MCDTAFGFGENDTYLLECPSRRCYNGLPRGILNSLEAGDIATTLNVAFGTEGAFMISYRQPCGRGVRVETAKLPEGLLTWLFAKDSKDNFERSFSDLQVSLGTKPDSYWASDGYSYIWKGIPEKLGEKLGTLRKSGGGWTRAPVLVTLGLGDDFVLVSKGNGSIHIFWNLDNYPDLEETIKVILDKKVLNGLQNLAMSPFKKDTYACLVNDILIQNGTPDKSKEAMGKLADDVKSDVASATKKAQASSAQSIADIGRKSQQHVWDMEHNSSFSLTREVCKSCTRPRGLCDCAVANYQTEYKF